MVKILKNTCLSCVSFFYVSRYYFRLRSFSAQTKGVSFKVFHSFYFSFVENIIFFSFFHL